MTQTELFPDSTTWGPDQNGRCSDMVLIRVPEIHVLSRVGPRIESRRPSSRLVSARRPRRRLRREIRTAAFATLAVVPILMAAGVWRLHPDRPLAAAEVSAPPRALDDPEPAPAAVLISIEPAVGSNDAEIETPVVFPGYILPDDHREEPAHEGS